MRYIATPILIILLLSQTFTHLFIVTAFRLEQSYIAKNLCENRYRPTLHCNGNCVLMKKLKQQEKQEQKAPAALKLEIQTLSSKSFFCSIEPISLKSEKSYVAPINAGKPIDRAIAVFHPPGV